MASSSTRKQCANGNGCKQMAAALCEGCSQALCTKHFIDHRRLLEEEMNVIISEHDQFQHTLSQQTTKPDFHSLIKQIDQWEQESIVIIQQKANELREQLLQLATGHLDELSQKLRHLSGKLQEGQESDSFVETDLQDWRKSLDDLKTNLVSPSTFSISRQDKNPLVQNVFVNMIGANDLFERVSDNSVRIEENGQVAIRDASTNDTEIRGKKEYTSGCHEVRLCIEQAADRWTFLGINSKSTPLQNKSYSCKSVYGWTNNNCLWLNGSGRQNTSIPGIEMKRNDRIRLIFDCDKRKISMINERTNTRYELDVDTNHCRFPWQLHIILCEANSRVRILPASS